MRRLQQPLLTIVLLAGSGSPLSAAAGEPTLPPGPHLSGRLTLDDALRILEESSLDLVAADAALADAHARALVAGALPNPVLSLGGGASWQCAGGGCQHPLVSAQLGDQGALSLLVTGQRGLAIEAARGGVRAAEAAREDALRNARFALKRQFVGVDVAERMLLLAEQEAAAARDTVRRARGAGPDPGAKAADVSRLEVLQLQIEQGQDAAERAAGQARAALALLLGARGPSLGYDVDLAALAGARWPGALAGATLETLHEKAARTRPDLAAARLALEQARVQADLARRQAIPPVALQLGYTMQGRAHDWFTPPTASLSLSAPLPLLYRQQGQVGQADAAVIQAEVALARAEAQVTADVASAWAALTAARSAARRAEERLLPRAREAEAQVRDEHARGGATLGELLDAQRVRIAAEVDVVDKVGGFWTALFQLEQAVGARLGP